MHPVQYLFEEIYRDYWGIPRASERRDRKRQDEPAWRLRRSRHREAR